MNRSLLAVIGVCMAAYIVSFTIPAAAQIPNSGPDIGAAASNPRADREVKKAARRRARKEARANQKSQINAAKAQGYPVGPVGDEYPKNMPVQNGGPKP
jgi:hypothetical protein